jgi:AcrR family transcriptional regulator
MPNEDRRPGRRAEALTREVIVETAIAILDADGVPGLTFRALAARLATGSGAIYWHVADKDTLLAAATDRIVADALPRTAEGMPPRDFIRAIATAVFETLEQHSWVGAQLSGDPWQHAVLRILEGVGGQLDGLGVPEGERFNAATALLSFILGLAGQYALRSRIVAAGANRVEVLSAVAAQWSRLDPEQHPFVRQVATMLADHDDREQFLAGIDLILAGITGRRRDPRGPTSERVCGVDLAVGP